MSKKILTASLRQLNLLTKIILVIAILIMAAVGGLAYMTSKGPIDLTFLKPHVEDALNDPAKNYKVTIDALSLTWPKMTAPLLLDLKNVHIEQKNAGQSTIEKVGLGVSTKHLLFGKVKPSIIIVDGPVFEIIERDGTYSFFWQSEEDAITPTDPIEEPVVEASPSEAEMIEESIENAAEESLEGAATETEIEVVETATVIKTKEPTVNPRQKMRKDIRTALNDIFNPEGTEYEILSALKRVELTNATLKNKGNILGTIDLALNKNRTGLSGDLDMQLMSAKADKATIKSDIVYRNAQKDLTFTSTLEGFNPAILAPYFPDQPLLKGQDLLLDGQLQAAFDDKFKLQLATIDFSIPEGKITVPDLYDEGLDLKDIIFKAHLNRPDKKLDVTEFKAVIGNVSVEGSSNATFGEGQIKAPIVLKIADVKTNDVGAVFPKSYIATSAGEWVTQKLSEGRIYDAVMTTDLIVTRNKETGERKIDVQNSKANFMAEGLTIKYSSTLMPVTNASAEGRYEDDTLFIKGTKGAIGDVQGSNVDLKMTNLSVKGGGMAYLTLNGSGPFKTVLKYASDDPISIDDTIGFDINTVKGNINFKLDMEFPTIKDLPKEKVIVKIDGKLTDILVPNIVQGLPLTGGPYDLSYGDGAINLKGSGQLAGRDVTLTWKEYMDATGQDFESKITAKIIADEGLRKAFNIGLESYISGPIPIDVTYIDRGVKSTVEVKGKLGPATLHIEPFDYKKEPGVAGNLSLKAHMKGEFLEEVDNLSLSTEGLTFSGGRLIFKRLKDGSTDISRGQITAATLGKTKAAVDFEITPQNQLKVIAKGSVVDASPFIKTDKKSKRWDNPNNEAKQAMIVSVQAQKLLMDKGESLSDAKIYLETDTQGDITRIEMDSKVGAGDMYLRFKPEESTGQRTFRLESSDAGGTLKAFGLNDKVRGGKIVIYGQPQKGDNKGNLFGKAEISDFRVVKAPALAKLINALSLTGAQNLLNNDGLVFAKLESDFEWKFREAGNLLVVKDGRTSGSSLGLTFEGVVNQGTNETDISGTVIPLSGVNNAIGGIPVIGKILTGGKAFLAATYTMKGPSNDPNVSVNPLSVLAPGFLRTILFEENVETKVKKAQ